MCTCLLNRWFYVQLISFAHSVTPRWKVTVWLEEQPRELEMFEPELLQVFMPRGGGTKIWLGGLVREATKHPIIHAKRLRVKVKNWGAPGSTALVYAIRLTLWLSCTHDKFSLYPKGMCIKGHQLIDPWTLSGIIRLSIHSKCIWQQWKLDTPELASFPGPA